MKPAASCASSIFAITLIIGCTPEDEGSNPFGATLTYGGSFGTTLTDTGETGDGDPGDGDGDPGDGDGAPTGDGDGAPTGDGDGGPADCPSNGPYEGGWDTGCCQNTVVPTGWFPGSIGPNSVLPDWTFTDQFGDAVRIYDFCHEAILFEYVAFWCGACQSMAPQVASQYNQFESQGFMTLTYMSENSTGGPAGPNEVSAWANMFGQAGIVAFSNHDNVWYPFGVDQGGGNYSIALPGTMLLGRNATIAKIGVPTQAEIQLVLP